MILIQSLIIGALVGISVGVGAAKMFNAPERQAMGAFRTLGEMNACKGDAVSHFSFGLGFLFNAWASVISAGAFTQDIVHRVIPNWAAAAVIKKGTKLEETLHNPMKMGIAGGIVGAIAVAALMTTAVGVPDSLADVAMEVLRPAAGYLIDLVMPIVFWLAAMDAGRRSGYWGTIFGGISQLVMGNAVPGVVLGILIGKGVDDLGWTKSTKILLTSVIILFVISAFFRQVDLMMLNQMGIDVPQWWQNFHNIFTIG
jgi:uncharacterized protein (TIGR03580 family)